jgi:hypothetical protein
MKKIDDMNTEELTEYALTQNNDRELREYAFDRLRMLKAKEEEDISGFFYYEKSGETKYNSLELALQKEIR